MENTLLQKNTAREIVTQGYLLVMSTVFLLFAGLDGYLRISDEKAALFCILSAGFLLALCFAGRYKTFRLSLTQWAMVAFLLMSLLSASLSPTPKQAFFGNLRHEGWVTLFLYVGIFLAVSRWGRADKVLLWVFSVAVSANCVIALLQMAGKNPFGLFPLGLTYHDAYVKYNGQFLGTAGNADFFAAVMSLCLPVLWLSLWKGSGRLRFLLLIPLALSVISLALSSVTGGMLGACAAILLTAPLLFSKKRGRCMALCAVLILLLAALMAVYGWGGRFGGALYEASELLHGRAQDSFGSGRIYIWKNVLRLVPERPLLGGGPDTLGLRGEILFSRYNETLGKTWTTSVDAAHNEYLNILVNQGVLSLVPYLGALGMLAVRWVKQAPHSPKVLILGGGVLGYGVQAFFGISTPTSAVFFWLILALLERELQNAK